MFKIRCQRKVHGCENGIGLGSSCTVETISAPRCGGHSLTCRIVNNAPQTPPALHL
ncbi:hypothetical protein MtrunA17_Chr2g0302671 [Medicago truncatula]|uniref:Uncharacterized protein n=1 Tax=Medicago truncatula TaxID=3880 RepID=A0A396J6K2_MEDTR|nr:hypothetical protein MtrunA17_Chr2g0302671 [Medicago truncatula]